MPRNNGERQSRGRRGQEFSTVHTAFGNHAGSPSWLCPNTNPGLPLPRRRNPRSPKGANTATRVASSGEPRRPCGSPRRRRLYIQAESGRVFFSLLAGGLAETPAVWCLWFPAGTCRTGLAQTPFCGVCDAPQGHVMDRPAPLPHRPTGPFGKSQTPQNGVCASHLSSDWGSVAKRELVAGVAHIGIEVGRVSRHLDETLGRSELHDPHVPTAAAREPLVIGEQLMDDVALFARV